MSLQRCDDDVQLKVLDELFGWTGFRESYGNSTWRWLVAALGPKYVKCFSASSLIGFLLYFRFLLSNASLSEESLCRVCGENKNISLSVIWTHIVHSTAIFAYFSNTGGYERRHQHLLQVSLQAECLPADPARQGDIHKVDTLANILFLKICFSRPSPDTWISRYRDQSLGFLLTLAATGRKVQVCKVYMTIFVTFLDDPHAVNTIFPGVLQFFGYHG